MIAADAVALAHAMLPLSIFVFAFFGPARLAWVSPLLVLLFFLNWHLDPDHKCFLTRWEAHLRNQSMDEFGGYMWRYLGSRLNVDSKDDFYFTVNFIYLFCALLGLMRFIDWAMPFKGPSGQRRGILKRS